MTFQTHRTFTVQVIKVRVLEIFYCLERASYKFVLNATRSFIVVEDESTFVATRTII